MMVNELLEAALRYGRGGLPVFPAWPLIDFKGGFACSCGKTTRCTSPGKHPMGNLVRRGLIDASTDEIRIRHWWASRPNANIGVVTGRVIVIDVDPRHGGDRTLERLERANGTLPATWRVCTGGGGTHLYFAVPSDAEAIKNSAGLLGAGVDVRATGGYVIAPPSRHISGGYYAWAAQGPLAPVPHWMIAALKQPRTKIGSPSAEWRELVRNGIAEGQRNQALARLAGHLLRRYVDPLVTLELLLIWNRSRCQPPLPDAEVKHTMDPIAGRELARRAA